MPKGDGTERAARRGPIALHTMPRCLVIQHVPAESAFLIGDALRACGVATDTRSVFGGAPVPTSNQGFDGIVVMGGPMSASSDVGFPTREAELALISDALRSGTPLLGICLGAQLLAVAAGAAVYQGTSGIEVGWGEVQLGPACALDPLFAGLPDTLEVLHWHGDTYDLPDGAVHLMGNRTYANQGFRLGDSAWGLQFHVEVTAEAVDDFVAAFPSEASLAEGGTEAIRTATPAALARLEGARDLVLGRFASLVLAHAGRRDFIESGWSPGADPPVSTV